MKKPKGCIFLVDDEKTIVDSIEAQFTYCGFEVIKATDPKKALEFSTQIKPDIIITDIRMPKLDGLTLLTKFKEIQPNVKVIVMTGFYPEHEKQIQDALSAGLVNKCIQKPFNAIDLEKLVYGLLKTPEDEIEFSRNSKGKILIVDDEAEVLEFLTEILRMNNYSAAIAISAQDALLIYEDFQPDVVLTDVKMPDHDGIWLLNKLREKHKDLKVIVMTGQDNHLMLERLRNEAGVTQHFSKPFGVKELERLCSLIEKLIGKK